MNLILVCEKYVDGMIHYPEFFIEFIKNKYPSFYNEIIKNGGIVCTPSVDEPTLFMVSNPMKEKEDQVLFEDMLAEYITREGRVRH
jgi:hypothetical protein